MKKAAYLVYAAASFSLAFVVILAIQLKYPIMYGIDGPYYLIQMRHLISDGAIKYPDPPLTYYMLAPFYLAFADKNLGLKIAVAFYGGLTAYMLYAAFRRYGDQSGLAASLTFAFSPFTLRLAHDLIKNCVSLLFIASFIYILVNVKNRRKAIIFSAAAALASAISHVLTFGVLALYAIIILMIYPFRRERCGVIGYAAASAAVTSLLILALTLTAFPQVVGYDSGKLLSFIENPFNQGKANTISPSFMASFVIGAAGIAYALIKRKSSEIALTSGALLILLNLPIIGSAWLFRFSLMASILIPPIAALIMREVKNSAQAAALLLIAGFMLTAIMPTASMLKPRITMRDYETLRDDLPKRVPAGSTLVVPNTGLRYWVEALHEDSYNVVNRPPRPPPPGTYLVLDKRVKIGKYPPPGGEVVLEGDYLEILKLR